MRKQLVRRTGVDLGDLIRQAARFLVQRTWSPAPGRIVQQARDVWRRYNGREGTL
jgi:hypothetical protein